MDASVSQVRAISHRTAKFFINIFSYRLSPTHELNVRNTQTLVNRLNKKLRKINQAYPTDARHDWKYT